MDELIRKIYEKCDDDNFQCAEDMQCALEEIQQMIEEKYPEVKEPTKSMLLHCPKDGAVVHYDEDLDLFVCIECEWTGLYYETIKPYEQNVKKP